MLGPIEHLCLLTQMLLSFIYGTYALAIPIVFLWLGYVATLVVFAVFWKRDILEKDYKLKQYQVMQDNVVSSRVRTILAWIFSWKFHKLLYSRFFGIKTNSFKFSNPTAVKTLMWRVQIANIVIWALLILLNVIGLIMTKWGTQLYIMMIENCILAFIFIALGIYEHYRMIHYWTVSNKLLIR